MCVCVSTGKEVGEDGTQGAAAPKRIKRDSTDSAKPLRVQRFGGERNTYVVFVYNTPTPSHTHTHTHGFTRLCLTQNLSMIETYFTARSFIYYL